MFELEVKAPIDDPEGLEKRLRVLGAKLVADESHVDVYYNAPHRDFARTDEALRMRIKRHPRGYVVTYKSPRISRVVKTREEFEVSVDDPEGAKRILERLGFKPAATVEKERRKYQIGGIKISIDHVRELGFFVEIEIKEKNLGSRERREQTIFELMDRLLIPRDRILDKTYLEMLLEKRASREFSDRP
ncbi:MAG: class IV adenylate cyclase [Candidatus Bathyarchaeia archaeon]